MIHEISDCKINTSQTVMYPIYNSMRCTEVLDVKQSYQMIHGQWIQEYPSLSPGSSPADSINRAQYCVHVGLPDYTGGDDTTRTRPVNMPTAGSGPSLVLWLPSVTTTSSSSGRVTFLDHHSPLPKPCLHVHPRKIFTYQKTYLYTQ